jgi:hypothetical protein
MAPCRKRKNWYFRNPTLIIVLKRGGGGGGGGGSPVWWQACQTLLLANYR